MLKSCPTCGRMHRYDDVCPKRIEYIRQRQEKYDRSKYKYDRNSAADKFRNTVEWKRKRNEIKDRDLNVCRYCFIKKHKITTAYLSVHHIISLEKNYGLRLDENNLITLCRECHEAAEKGKITAKELRKIIQIPIKIQADSIRYPPGGVTG